MFDTSDMHEVILLRLFSTHVPFCPNDFQHSAVIVK